jgi:hypothetical protein
MYVQAERPCGLGLDFVGRGEFLATLGMGNGEMQSVERSQGLLQAIDKFGGVARYSS